MSQAADTPSTTISSENRTMRAPVPLRKDRSGRSDRSPCAVSDDPDAPTDGETGFRASLPSVNGFFVRANAGSLPAQPRQNMALSRFSVPQASHRTVMVVSQVAAVTDAGEG